MENMRTLHAVKEEIEHDASQINLSNYFDSKRMLKEASIDLLPGQ